MQKTSTIVIYKRSHIPGYPSLLLPPIPKLFFFFWQTALPSRNCRLPKQITMYAKLLLLAYTLLLLIAMSLSVPQWQWPNFGYGVQSGGSGYTCMGSPSVGGFSTWCGSGWKSQRKAAERTLNEIRSCLLYLPLCSNIFSKSIYLKSLIYFLYLPL